MNYINSIWILVSLCFGTTAMATDYYVSPKGNDLWSGSVKQPTDKLTDGPFKSLERAKQAIRALKEAHTFNDKVTVNIATGNYYLNHPLNFNLLDSGLPGREILWQGEPGAKVTISAGMPINCKKGDAAVWDCPLTKLPASTAYFDTNRIKGNTPKFELFVNDQKMQLARWPDKDWAHIKLPVDQKTQFTVMETLPELTGDIKAAQVHIFAGNDWYDQYIGVDSVNQSGNSIKLSATTVYPLASGRRFYIQNLPSFLNSPGEWIYNASNKKISFIPPAGLNPTMVMLSSLPNILIADGISYLTFKNISFQHSTATAITLKNATNVMMDQLDVNSIGGKGVDINGGQNVQLSNSKIHHTGGHGVVVSGGDRNTLQASGHVIHNNHIDHMGTTILTYSSGIEVNGVGTKITHNLLEQGSGTAILITGNDHLIEKNEVHHFCLQASDCGAILSGRNWSFRGNAIRYNYIHDIIGYGMVSVDVVKNNVIYKSPDGARGVYLDDGMSGFEVRGNIFVNAGSIALQLGGGRDNSIYNNYFNTNGYAIWVDDRWPAYNWDGNKKSLQRVPYKSAIWQAKYPKLALPMNNDTWPEGNSIQRNIIITNKPGGLALRYQMPAASNNLADNLVWNTSGPISVDYKILDRLKSGNGAPWLTWVAEGLEKFSINADPCATIAGSRINFCATSPANKIGFQSLPTDIGLIK